MQKVKLISILVVVALLFVSGCRSGIIRNIENAPIVTSTNNYSLGDVTQAIQVAGTGLGWNMARIEPGLLAGSLALRAHRAEIEITYNRNNYSIYYVDSTNLAKDGNRIHSNYNGWIERLENAIDTQLLGL